jgi:hypothetical protein
MHTPSTLRDSIHDMPMEPACRLGCAVVHSVIAASKCEAEGRLTVARESSSSSKLRLAGSQFSSEWRSLWELFSLPCAETMLRTGQLLGVWADFKSLLVRPAKQHWLASWLLVAIPGHGVCHQPTVAVPWQPHTLFIHAFDPGFSGTRCRSEIVSAGAMVSDIFSGPAGRLCGCWGTHQGGS